LKGIEGTVPSVAHYPQGCRFHPRCPRAEAICAAVSPPFIASRDGAAACHFAGAVG
jgi:peptide/nickel transport system ATP-binding protein